MSKRPRKTKTGKVSYKKNKQTPASPVVSMSVSTKTPVAMSRQLIEQQRAAYVLDKIRQVTHELDSTEQTEFRSYCNSLPAMVLRNGLGQAMAFVKSKAQGNKGGKAYYQLFNMIEQWLCQGRQAYSDCNSLMTGITERDMQHYRLAQAETLSLLVWVRKFARAEIAAPSTDTGGIS